MKKLDVVTYNSNYDCFNLTVFHFAPVSPILLAACPSHLTCVDAFQVEIMALTPLTDNLLPVYAVGAVRPNRDITFFSIVQLCVTKRKTTHFNVMNIS